jgi:hypothetical protein
VTEGLPTWKQGHEPPMQGRFFGELDDAAAFSPVRLLTLGVRSGSPPLRHYFFECACVGAGDRGSLRSATTSLPSVARRHAGETNPITR